jgi:predicted DNA-binding transcriptional regulator AlpA
MPDIIIPLRHHLDSRACELIADGQGEPDDLLTTRQVAEWFSCSKEWLEIGRSKGYGPPFKRLGPKRVRYSRSDVLQWLKERTHRSTAEYILADDVRPPGPPHIAAKPVPLLGHNHGPPMHEESEKPDPNDDPPSE